MQVGSLFLVEISPSCSTSGTNPFVFWTILQNCKIVLSDQK